MGNLVVISLVVPTGVVVLALGKRFMRTQTGHPFLSFLVVLVILSWACIAGG